MMASRPKSPGDSPVDLGSGGAELWFDNVIGTPWRNLLSTQATYLRELWELAGGFNADPAGGPARLQDFWSRWASPATWLGVNTDARMPTEPAVVYFVLDGVAEATPEREIEIGSSFSPTGNISITPLRNVVARGEIAAAHVEARFIGSSAGSSASRRIEVALVNLGSVNQSLKEKKLERGLYVGGILAGEPGGAPLAVVQALVG